MNERNIQFEIKKNPKKINILGTGSGSQLAPQNTSNIVYCLNDYVHKKVHKIQPDKLFIMDVLDEKPLIVSGMNDLGEMIAAINALRCPLIAPFKYEEIPLSEAYPLDETVRAFGKPYFSNTIAYMIAYALLEFLKIAREERVITLKAWAKQYGIELTPEQGIALLETSGRMHNLHDFSLELFGINQASSSEYFYEKAGVEYWLGIANGLGVDITINGDKSELLTNKHRFGGSILYGYNQSYAAIKSAEEKFGKPTVKKLSKPPRAVSRNVRRINS